MHATRCVTAGTTSSARCRATQTATVAEPSYGTTTTNKNNTQLVLDGVAWRPRLFVGGCRRFAAMVGAR
jgi:hypothetical protein